MPSGAAIAGTAMAAMGWTSKSGAARGARAGYQARDCRSDSRGCSIDRTQTGDFADTDSTGRGQSWAVDRLPVSALRLADRAEAPASSAQRPKQAGTQKGEA